MWINGDYRVSFRHHSTGWDTDVMVAEAVEVGDIPMASTGLLSGSNGVTVATLSKVIHEGELSAVVDLSVGHAVCSHRDQYNKAVGRKLAFERALAKIQHSPHYSGFGILYWNYIIKPSDQKTAARIAPPTPPLLFCGPDVVWKRDASYGPE